MKPWACPLCGWRCDDDGPDLCPADGAPMTRVKALEGLLPARLELGFAVELVAPADAAPTLALPAAVQAEREATREPGIHVLDAEHEPLIAALQQGRAGPWVTARGQLAGFGPDLIECWRFSALAEFRSMADAVAAADAVGATAVRFEPPRSYATLDWDVDENGGYAERLRFGAEDPPVG